MTSSDFEPVYDEVLPSDCIALPVSDHHSPLKDSDIRLSAGWKIRDLIVGYPKTQAAWDILTKESEIPVIWDMAEYITTEKLRMNDHGRTHALVTAASSLRILELLQSSGIVPDVVKTGIGDPDDASLIVLLSSLCHDIGNSIHRTCHLHHSLILVQPILDRILPAIYDNPYTSMQVRLFILSSINSHHGDPSPLTVEGSIVSIGDASDMAKGRADHSRDITKASIHAISTLSVDRVDITKGVTKPVEIQISLSHIAGMYQIQETLIPKIKAGTISSYVSVYIPVQHQYVY
ncbi:MAG: hypothetical protein LUQ07_02045 [Methanospirillum sp.]|nr:hypothetical protein [Methanospirillum sp.]